jgi:malate dehydrogenase
MKFLTDEKILISGAAGMIGSNMAQTAIMMGLSSNICMYDPFAAGLEGAAEEMYHCGFDEVNLTWTTDVPTAFKDAKYIVSSGGAPRKAGMTREDLLKGNAEIAAQLGKDIKQYCPDAKHVTIIFNPADITGLVTLLFSGLKASQLTTLAALDSTRLQTELAKQFNVPRYKVTNCRTYGGHGEQMAVFASTASVDGKPLTSLIGGDKLSVEQWNAIKGRVTQGGKRIIELRGRSSFQSPSYVSMEMIRAAIGGEGFRWASGAYINNGKFNNIMMGWETKLDKNGVTLLELKGTPEEMKELEVSYGHLCKLRDEVIAMGVMPPVAQWGEVNPNLVKTFSQKA